VAGTPVTFLWNWLWVDPVMVLYAIAANGPCLVTQRYNRARLQRILAPVGPAGPEVAC
jgi:glycosyl-4,4'-diaponeurosporenoate acyltransferase